MEEILIEMGLAAIKAALKNTTLAEKFKEQLQEIALAIDTVYPPE